MAGVILRTTDARLIHQPQRHIQVEFRHDLDNGLPQIQPVRMSQRARHVRQRYRTPRQRPRAAPSAVDLAGKPLPSAMPCSGSSQPARTESTAAWADRVPGVKTTSAWSGAVGDCPP